MNIDKNKSLNLVEAYTKYNKKLFIIITGLSGCGKLEVSKKLATLLNITHLEQNNYFIKNYSKKVTLPNKVTVINRNSDDAIDWNKLNNDIAKYASKTGGGVVLSGFAIPSDKIKLKPDYYISLAIPKKECLEQRIKFITKHKDKYKKEYTYINDDTEKLMMNLLIFPYFLSSNKRSKIDKYINVVTKNQVLSDVFDALIDNLFTQENVEKLYWNYSNKHNKEDGIMRVNTSKDTSKDTSNDNSSSSSSSNDFETSIVSL